MELLGITAVALLVVAACIHRQSVRGDDSWHNDQVRDGLSDPDFTGEVYDAEDEN